MPPAAKNAAALLRELPCSSPGVEDRLESLTCWWERPCRHLHSNLPLTGDHLQHYISWPLKRCNDGEPPTPGDLPQHGTTLLGNGFFTPTSSLNLPSCTFWLLPLVQSSATVRRVSLHRLRQRPASSSRLQAGHPLAPSAPDWSSLTHPQTSKHPDSPPLARPKFLRAE